jgi:hypothetical protein
MNAAKLIDGCEGLGEEKIACHMAKKSRHAKPKIKCGKSPGSRGVYEN